MAPRSAPFRAHQCLARRRTQLIDAWRGHLAEFGLVAPKGPASLKPLENALADETTDLPDPVREVEAVSLGRIANLTEATLRLADELEAATKTDEELRRLRPIPGIGPVTTGAVAAFAPDLDTFDSGRDLFAGQTVPRTVCFSRSPRLGLAPRQGSTGGKTKLGSGSKMGLTDIRRLVIVGASCRRRASRATSVIRWAVGKGGSPNRWLVALVARKPKMVAAVALSNKMARMIWAVTTEQEDHRMA
jgi:transposase